MSKKDWHRIKETKYLFCNIEGSIQNLMNNKRNGVISLIQFNSITDELKVNYLNKELTLLAKDYYWFQIAFQNENFWITAVLSPDLTLLQIYIDITKKNIVKSNGESFFYDLFLDIVVMDTCIFVLDEEEIEEAKLKKIITDEEYDMAVKTKNRLLLFLSDKNNIGILKEYLFKEINNLINIG